MIEVTESALAKFADILKEEKSADDLYIRIYVSGAG